jgi:hypothetical protein
MQPVFQQPAYFSHFMIVTVYDFSKKSETEQLPNPVCSRGRFVSVFLLQSRRLLGYVCKRLLDLTVELNSSYTL